MSAVFDNHLETPIVADPPIAPVSFDDALIDSERLADFESVATRLWPFVRYFALAGGHPDAIAAVADLAVLLNVGDESNHPAAEASLRSRNQTLDSVADWFQGSKFYRGMMSSLRDEMIRELKALKDR